MTRKGRDWSIRALLLIVIGTVLGGFFFYLAFWDISWPDLLDGLSQLDYRYLLPAALLTLFIQFLRAFRFGLIVNPFCRMSTRDLWDLMNIWGAVNMLIPGRLAELAKPYLLQQRGASFSSSLGAVLVERFFDLLGLLSLLAVVLWSTPELPAAYSLFGKELLVALVAAYVAVLLVLWRREKVQVLTERLLSRFPDRMSSFVGGAVRRLVDGLGIMASGRQAVLIFGCSVMIWLLFAGVAYIFLLAFSINVVFLVAITIQVLLCFGNALPSAPGFIGTFHAVGRYALALFGVGATPAISFAIVYHVFSLVFALALGIISYWLGDFRLDYGLFPNMSSKSPAPDGEPLTRAEVTQEVGPTADSR